MYFRKVLHLAAQGIDYITVPTRFECEYYAKWLGFPQEKIFYCPHGIVDGFQGLSPLEREIYAYSGGRSERDYQTLFQAISSLDVLFIINARQYNCKGIPIPKNVILNDLVSPNQFRGLNWGSKFVVVPLDAVRQAAGITSVLWAMAAGKATIASDVPGLHDYLVEGDTGLFVPPRDVVKLRHAIEYLWNNPGEAGRLGENARQAYLQNFTFEHLANRVIGILSNLELG
ncbi:MAG: glycosyltransferase family 4 protein [Anaerolineales bacterium]|nr:glycosyltransferase family 4 protein [Anaerolineales bacterium]